MTCQEQHLLTAMPYVNWHGIACQAWNLPTDRALLSIYIHTSEQGNLVYKDLIRQEKQVLKSLNDSFKLSNGYSIPCIGFGTWKVATGESGAEVVRKAIESGYRHIDGAAIYGNEKDVGAGIRASGIAREELFITSKVWNDDRGYKTTLAAFDRTLNDLGLEYLDLYLIHWPASSSRFDDWEQINLDTWQAMTELYKAGRIKSIGVSNFLPHHLKALLGAEVKPMVNQLEIHPGYLQRETVELCQKEGIVVEAWSPLGQERIFNNPLLIELAAKYGKSVAQICLRWCLQHNTLPLPKTATPSRMVENTQVFDFEISAEDMQRIDALPVTGESGLYPDEVTF